MKLFGYYAWHTFLNTLKKMLKSWVLVFFVVCVFMGVLIGLGAAWISDLADENAAGDEQYEEYEDWEDWDEEDWDDWDEEDWEDGDWMDGEAVAARAGSILELVAGGASLAVLVFMALGADKSGGSIFQPADVNLLFASPMKPQSVLMFRLTTQLGAALLMSVYVMIFQVPNLLHSGFSGWTVLSIIAAWAFVLMFGTLIKLLLYMLGATHPRVKPMIRPVIFTLLGVAALAYVLQMRLGGLGALEAAAVTFNAPATRLIPIWGWIKGLCAFAWAGDTAPALLCALALVLGAALMIAVIWRIPADFYEDAMAKSEETAELQRQIQSSGSLIARRKVDRADSVRRDGLTRGAGANVFFYKSLYNRFRFAKFGVLTKTAGTYLAAAMAVSLLTRFALESDSLEPAVLVLGGMVFFRSLGNPLSEDTGKEFFRLIPESALKKMAFSLLGGSVNCLLDLLPALLLAVIVLLASPLEALAWLCFLLSVDFYSTSAGVFIDLSVPISIGRMVKQLVQILFLYFGLLPDIALIAVGFATENVPLWAAAAAAVNAVLGLLFFFLCPLVLEPAERGIPGTLDAEGLREAKRVFSRVGWVVFAFLLAASAGQILALTVVPLFLPDLPAALSWVLTFAPIYCLGLPAGLLAARKAPGTRPAARGFGWKQWLLCLPVCFLCTIAGNVIGTLVVSALRSLFGLPVTAVIQELATDDSTAMKLLFLVICAPVAEELVFRKTIIDRIHVYGERRAVVCSALLFGLFHGNFTQFFYAAALGLVFGYVYLRTGRLRYSIALHMLINFNGSILGPALLERTDADALENLFDFAALRASGALAYGVYALAQYALAAAGLVVLCAVAKDIRFEAAARELPPGTGAKTVWRNPGMITAVVFCLIFFAASLFS